MGFELHVGDSQYMQGKDHGARIEVARTIRLKMVTDPTLMKSFEVNLPIAVTDFINLFFLELIPGLACVIWLSQVQISCRTTNCKMSAGCQFGPSLVVRT